MGPDRRVIEGQCRLLFLLAPAFVRDPIVTSVCVQVPEDTFFFFLSAGMHKVRRDIYWTMRGGIKAMWCCVLSRIYGCSSNSVLPHVALERAPECQGGLGN